MISDTKTWLAVINPHAGSGKTMDIWVDARVSLVDRNVSFEEKYTAASGDAIDIADSCAQNGYRRFLAVGGDGTAHEVLNGIMRYVDRHPDTDLSDFTMAVIPIGSGNDWIKSHEIPKDIPCIVDLIASESFAEQDVVRVTEHGCKPSYMLNIGGIGIDAKVCELVNRRKIMGRSGKLLYVKALLDSVVLHRPKPMEVLCDGISVFKGKVYSMAFGIGRYCGGGMRQCSDALMDDGLLDVTIIPHKKLMVTVMHMWKVFSSSFSQIRTVLSQRCRRIEILPLEGVEELMESDGEVVAHLPVCLEIVGQRIKAVSMLKKSGMTSEVC